MSKARSDTRGGGYAGPAGDDTTYFLPRDLSAWEASWAASLGQIAPAPIASQRGEHHAPDMSPEAVEERSRLKRREAEALSFVRTYSGTFGLILDIRADRRFGSAYMRLSERQVDAILNSRDRDLARAESNQIDRELYADEQYASRSSQPVATPPTVITEGMYTVDGQPWKVQHTRADHTRLYAKRLDVIDGKGTWEYVTGGLSVIRSQGVAMTLEEAQAFGKLYGICAVCGAELTDETSIERGIGPVCAGRL